MTLDESIRPEWDAATLFVAYLYGVWAGAHWISGQSTRSDGSAAGLVIYFIAFLVGLIACLVFTGAFGFGLRLCKSPLLHGLALLLALLAFLAGYGWPHWFALLVGMWFALHAYWHMRKKQQDQDNLVDFE